MSVLATLVHRHPCWRAVSSSKTRSTSLSPRNSKCDAHGTAYASPLAARGLIVHVVGHVFNVVRCQAPTEGWHGAIAVGGLRDDRLHRELVVCGEGILLQGLLRPNVV